MKIRSITAPNPGPFTLDGTRTWLLGESAVIDPGPAVPSHVEAVLAALPQLATIFITHRHGDHAPAAVPLKSASGARIVAPVGVLSDDDVDERIRGGEQFAVEGEILEVIATPGHTREHVCFLTSDGELFTGDTVLGTGTTAIFPPDGDISDYLNSLRLLRSHSPKRIHPAHGPDRDDAVELLDEYIRHRLAREAQVFDLVRRGDGATISDLRQAIYPELVSGVIPAAEAQLLAHLIKLEREGRIARRGETFSPLR